MKVETIKVYRCKFPKCLKLSTSAMIKNNGRCFSCGWREFTNSGKIGIIEEIITLIRHYFISRRVK